MIDMILLNPRMSKASLAREFGYSPNWVCRIIASDAFRAKFEERRQELINPRLKGALNERIKSLLVASSSRLLKKMDEDDSASAALDALGLITKMEAHNHSVTKPEGSKK
jgi:hypothetical protein